MLNLRPINRNFFALLHDTAMASLSFLIAVYIRLGDDNIRLANSYLKTGAVVFTLVALGVFLQTRLYRGSWRYASLRDLVEIVKAVTMIILIFASMMFFVTRLESLPRTVLIINWMVLLVLLGGSRLAYRALRDGRLLIPTGLSRTSRIPVLLIGAENEAEQFIRDLSRDPTSIYEVVAIVDNNPHYKNRTIHGIHIYGGIDMLSNIVRKMERKGKRPQKIVLTGSDISGEMVSHLLDAADGLGLPLARLPRLSELKTGAVDKQPIQPIAVEDLLGRAQNVLDRAAMKRLIEGRVVLVTGAGGTIGGELTRQIASYRPSELVIVELSEYHLYQIEREIRGRFPELSLHVVLADVRDRAHVDSIFARHRPDIVLHAAAIKHVPIAEFNIEETILTNVFGSRNIAEASVAHSARAMVMISTDKAVNPTNVMGASKRLAESYCQALGSMEKGATKFITVRFGNVLGSTGSVVPLFQEQLTKGGPITVTHADMTRYFMTVREAVELVLEAAVLGVAMQDRKECIFVLDMGKPMKIIDLARQMIKLAGLTPDKDIQIVYTGLRPGEKLHEELFHGAENIVRTSHTSIFLASPRSSDIEALRKAFESLHLAARERQPQEALSLLKSLVPEFNRDPRYPNN
jgi:FlaA1/EpsC-like NDP-sugar epimerase